MNAMAEPVQFTLPKKPRIKEKDAPPDQRKVAVLPIRAIGDKKLTDGMFRVLAILCSYCNRAGLTWVGQIKLAQDMGVSQQAINKQLLKLQAAGYVELVSKGFRGVRGNTLRVIFDPSVDTETAIAITSSQEDTRPPVIREQQQKAMQQEQPDPEGQRKIAQLVAKALKQPPKPKERTMPKTGQTRTVQLMHEQIKQTKAKRTKPVDKPVNQSASSTTPEVVNDKPLHSQPEGPPFTTLLTTSEVVRTPEEHLKDNLKESISKRIKSSLNNLDQSDFDFLIDKGMTLEQIEDAASQLLPLFQAEGLTPSSRVLTDSIRELHKVRL